MRTVPKVAIRAHYERFPATVKGAFVLRSADRDPHQVAMRAARVVEAAGAGSHAIDLAPVVLDVAPKLDLFVPFEFPVTELEPGWYGLECDVEVDGSPGTERPGKRFAIAWPRSTVRRGTVRIGQAVTPPDGPKVQLAQLDCEADAVRLRYSSETAVDLRLLADGRRLAVVEQEFDPETGRGHVMAYPAMKTHERIRVEVRPHGKPRADAAGIELRLP